MPADPQQIQREIEATRAELAATVEAIADKVSPKKVAARGVATAKDAALDKGLTAYAAVENTFAPHPVPPAIPPLPLIQRVKWDRVGSVMIGLGLFIVAVVSFRSRPAKWERKQAKLQRHDLATLSRKARKRAAKAQKKAHASRHQAGTTALANLASARHLAEKSAGEARKQAKQQTKATVKAAKKQAKQAGKAAQKQTKGAAKAAQKQAKSAAKAAQKQAKKAAGAGHDAVGKVKELAS